MSFKTATLCTLDLQISLNFYNFKVSDIFYPTFFILGQGENAHYHKLLYQKSLVFTLTALFSETTLTQ